MFIKYLKPFLLSALLVIVLTFGQVIAELLLPHYMSRIVNEGIAAGDTAAILRLGAMMLGFSLVAIVCAVASGFFASRAAVGVGRNLRARLFSHVSTYSAAEYDKIGTASLITRTTNDVQQVQFTSFMVLRMMLRGPLMGIGAIIMAVGQDRQLSVVLLIMLPMAGALIWVVSRKAVPLFRSIQRKLDRLNLVLRENLIGMRIIRAFGRVRYEKQRFGEANADLTRTAVRVNRIMALLNPSMMISMNVLVVAIIWLASMRIDRGDLSVGGMMAFIQYAMQIFMSLTMLTMMFVMLPRAAASAERVEQVLALHPHITDPTDPVQIAEPRGEVVFDNVTFKYPDAEKPLVTGISFRARPGQTVAVIGGTGSGKSTLLRLLMRDYDVSGGNITVDGVDIRRMRQHDLREMMGYVPQSATLFSGTIVHNIRIGRRDATREEVRHACAVAQAAEFIEAMPKGYDSHVAQGGMNLSGGQKQRLAIARAVVRRPRIYIFDDSFSALDFRTDAALRAALKKETTDATTIVVAQRVSSIMDADLILVMERGGVIGAGTHDQLLETCEVYREIVLSQLSDGQGR